MCGRFTLGVDERVLKDFIQKVFEIKQTPLKLQVPRYNIAPGQDIISIINDGEKYRIGTLKWGFVPSFSNDENNAFKMINARAETLSERVSYKKSFQSKRCVILADGFYEWKKLSKEKIPNYITLKSKKIFPMAGLWSTFTKEDGTKVHTCTIITTKANRLVETIHDRMPVILDEDFLPIWLDPKIQDLDYLSRLLIPYTPELMTMNPASLLVNQVTNDSFQCLIP